MIGVEREVSKIPGSFDDNWSAVLKWINDHRAKPKN